MLCEVKYDSVDVSYVSSYNANAAAMQRYSTCVAKLKI